MGDKLAKSCAPPTFKLACTLISLSKGLLDQVETALLLHKLTKGQQLSCSLCKPSKLHLRMDKFTLSKREKLKSKLHHSMSKKDQLKHSMGKIEML